MTKRYDTIVIGGGHNGLVCAAYLAKSGQKVLVAESRPALGGLAVGVEFHEGYRSSGPLSDPSRFRKRIIRELSLERHGLKIGERGAPTAVIGREGRVLLGGTVESAGASIAEISKNDAKAFAEFRGFIDAVTPAVRAFTENAPVDLIHLESEPKLELFKRALGIRRLGRSRMLELFRVVPMSSADWLSEYFESGVVRAGLALPALAETYAGPRAPGTAANVLLRETGEEVDIEGGSLALCAALERACESMGVELTTHRPVQSIVLEGRGVAGIHCADGEDAVASRVVCACDPRTGLLELVPRGALPASTEYRMRNWRARGSLAHMSIAVEAEIELGDGARRLLLADDLDDIERAFDAVKYRRCSKRPVLDIRVDGGDTAPKEASVLSVRVHNAPSEHEGGYTEAVRSELSKAVLERIADVLPEVADSTVGTRLWCPPDIAEEYGTTGGHLEHGEMALDQILVRPIPECNGYRTPIDGLYLASSGSHPGGGLTGLPGALAASAIAASA